MIEKKDREKRTEDLKSASVWSQSCTWYFRLTGHKLALAGLFKIAACKRYFIYIYFSPLYIYEVVTQHRNLMWPFDKQLTQSSGFQYMLLQPKARNGDMRIFMCNFLNF